MDILCESVPFGGEWYLKALVVRHAELRAPLGRTYTIEELAVDVAHIHFVARNGEEVAATITLAPHENGFGQLRQVAVAANHQGKGVGRALTHCVEAHARELGFTHLFLNSRKEPIPFYEKIGYRVEGEPFELVGLPHQRMVKVL